MITPLPKVPYKKQYSKSHIIISSYSLFPKSLGDLITRHGVQSLHTSLSKGRSPHDLLAPPGLDLLVTFEPSSPSPSQTLHHFSTKQRWGALLHGLSSLFCGSFQQLAPASTSPLTSSPNEEQLVYHAQNPREPLCIENMASWAKLLPCGSTTGQVSLLRRNSAFVTEEERLMEFSDWPEAEQQTLTVAYQKTLLNTQELTLTLQLFFRTGAEELVQMVGKHPPEECSAASRSQIQIQEVNDKSETEKKEQWKIVVSSSLSELEDSGRLRLRTEVRSEGREEKKCPLDGAVYRQVISPFLKPIFHKLSVKDPSSSLPLDFKLNGVRKNQDDSLTVEILLPTRKRDGCDRESLIVELELEKRMLPVEKYPPDSERGLDIFPVLIFSSRGDGKPRRFYGPSHVVVLPTPDFSMIFNAIMIAGSVIAMTIGSFFSAFVVTQK